ncbi:hypothetical protein BJV77DRAFT_1018453 [Russula vinacea]|nr:hypothetical protein BJV77DRAFT_1018453 [Russula vinacea]
MSAFTFDFDLEDDLDESFDAIPPQELASVSSLDKTLVSEGAPGGAMPAEEITLSVLVSDNSQFFGSLVAILCGSAAQLSALPEAFSSGHTLARRDLFDVRFQLSLSERDEQNHASVATFVDAPADVVPGTYEGGLKTWECALDLAAYLDRDILGAHAGVAAGRRVCGSRVLELGCGTAVPTLLLLDRLFAYLASEPGVGSPSSVMMMRTHIHLQDYNRSVLELVTFPNVLLAWYMSPLSAEHRSSATDSDSDVDNNEDEEGKETARGRRAAPGRGKPGGLTVTRIRLRFFAGSWESLREMLPHQGRLPYDIVLASETIYRTEALDAFEVLWPLCLVAAKVLYFGVGGNVQGFVHVVEREHGTVCTMYECLEGVGRIIMCVEW